MILPGGSDLQVFDKTTLMISGLPFALNQSKSAPGLIWSSKDVLSTMYTGTPQWWTGGGRLTPSIVYDPLIN